MAPTLLFDLDGTLVDSLPDLTSALNRLMARRGLPAFAPAEVAGMVGDGLPVLLQRAFAARCAEADPAAQPDFLADYLAHVAVETRPFPGVPRMLAALTDAGWQLAVCTNKPLEAAQRLLAALGLDRRFAAIGGGDSFAVRKPDPAHLLATLEAAGGQRDAAVMAGDHINDVRAAAGAGIPSIFAAWGYGRPGMAADATALAHSPAEVPALAAGLLSSPSRAGHASGPRSRSRTSASRS